MKKVLTVVGLLSLIVTIGMSNLWAQQEEEYYSYGTVSKIQAGEISIQEYDYEKDEDVEYAYVVDENIKLHNVERLDAIMVGDEAEITYVEKDGMNVAVEISIERQEL